jgi:hypothetical protein
MGLEMLASILVLMAGTIMVSWVAILCGIKAPIEEWSFIGWRQPGPIGKG